LDRKPWASGERVLPPLYRYSRQHSHSLTLHSCLRACFVASGTLPYRLLPQSSSFGTSLQPRYIYGAEELDQ